MIAARGQPHALQSHTSGQAFLRLYPGAEMAARQCRLFAEQPAADGQFLVDRQVAAGIARVSAGAGPASVATLLGDIKVRYAR
ncbi:hypothetical protein [Mesorhizobium huakuii]|uniref:Uncharacterized protein n=1 Tax=Mesorhizobium huakuii TaxID=28104 RepID=A0A7G6STN3_9HYPH|nr:hypothetical protein [Mesorhizobium huakuii]QND57865.1 hypothetical protein HB778_15605 [Mesorhizobium huakuii]